MSGRLLARNAALSLVGQVAPLVVALAAIPPLIRGLGNERFGVLTLAWAAVGYFSVFEFGLGRALTQRVAQRLGQARESELPGVVRAALLMLLLSGIVGSVLLAGGSTFLVNNVLDVPSDALRSESIVVFWVLAAALPFVLLTTGLRGLMEAHQHFGVATALRLPSAVLSYLGPLCTLFFSTSLVPAVAVIAAGRVLSFALHLIVCVRNYPYLSATTQTRSESPMALIRFGAWMTVSNIVSPMMSYLDRFFVGATIGMAAVTAYATPQEAAMKLLVIPAALTAAAFPSLASVMAVDPTRGGSVYHRCMRAVLIVMFPVSLAAVLFAREALQLWVGPLLPPESATVLQWLALGIFATAFGQVAATALQSAGRPDIIARLHLAELPLYAAGLTLLSPRLGVTGIAIVWAARCVLDAVVLAWLAYRQLGVYPLQGRVEAWILLAMLSLMAVGSAMPDTMTRVLFAVIAGATFGPVIWMKLLTDVERDALRRWLAANFAQRLGRVRG